MCLSLFENRDGGLTEVIGSERCGHLRGDDVTTIANTETSDTIRPMLWIKQVLALVSFSRATLYREMEAGRFPAAREIAPRRVAWFADDVRAWQAGTRKVA